MGKLRENWNLGKIFIGINPKPQSINNNPYQKGYQE
jgi:hypothetical protein